VEQIGRRGRHRRPISGAERTGLWIMAGLGSLLAVVGFSASALPWVTAPAGATQSKIHDTPAVRPASAAAAGAPSAAQLPAGSQLPFGSHRQPYAAGTLRPSGPPAQLDAQVLAVYRDWQAAFVRRDCGAGHADHAHVISPDADHPIVGEAQGYGMVITALMAGADAAAQTTFDSMVRYVLAHPSRHDRDLLAAEQDGDCTSVNGTDSATDADLDVAYALLLADRQWGRKGRFDYHQLALARLKAIKRSEVDPATHLLRLGDWSAASGTLTTVSRPSDWIIDHLRAFRRASGDRAWDTIRAAHQSAIARMTARYAPRTGLLPDFVVDTDRAPRPAAGRVLEDDRDGQFYWNACRVPWRLGADAVTSGDPASVRAARTITTWIRRATGGDPDRVSTGYTLAGEALGGRDSGAFFAPFAVAALVPPALDADRGGAQAWLDALWRRMVATVVRPDGYYAASVRLQSMLVASGNYWVP
jgi:endo-1,4-beta-D-glucanase Y